MTEKNYLEPELIPVRFVADDVIATSAFVTGGNVESGDGEGGNPMFPPFRP